MQMKLKLSSIAAVVALAATTLTANASVIGMADLTIGLLAIRNLDTGKFVLEDDVKIVGGTRTSKSSAFLNGVSANDSSSADATGNADAMGQCLGACGNAALLAAYGGNLTNNNATTHINLPLAPAVNYALGDSQILGSALQGGSAGLTRANGQISGPTNFANANGNLINEVSVAAIFTAVNTFNADFYAVYDSFLRTFIDAQHYGNNGKSSTSAGINFNLTVYDETDGVWLQLGTGQDGAWQPSGMNGSISTATANNGSAKSVANNGSVDSFDVVLKSGHSYQFTATQNSSVQMSSIPEPASLALVGLALTAVGFARRSKNAK